MVHLPVYCLNILQWMQLSRELPVSLQLTRCTLLLNVNTEHIAELYNGHTGEGKINLSFFPGQKTGCTHRDNDEEEEVRETDYRDTRSQTYSSKTALSCSLQAAV